MNKTVFQDGLKDIVEGLGAYRLWLHYAWMDTKMRYRRSTLGPFWITINLAVMVATVGTLYSVLFKIEISDYLPYFAVGITIWTMLSSFINDATGAFVGAEALIKQVSMPLSLHLIRVIARNIIIFLHNLVVLVICALVFGKYPGVHSLLIPVMLLLVSANFFFLGLIIAVFSTRFRDVPQIIISLLQVFMLFTPIFWMRSLVPEGYESVYSINPFFHFIEIVRSPLLGQSINNSSLAFSLISLVVLAAVAVPFFGFFRKRIPYWL